MPKLSIPPTLTRLIANGVWPSGRGPGDARGSRPQISPEKIRKFAPEEKEIYLVRPPFRTIAKEMKSKGSSEFWLKHGALHQISPEKALIIGDFGDGSDTAIILDFGSQMMDPPVLRLRWNPDRSTEWVKVANGIDEFSSMLGL